MTEATLIPAMGLTRYTILSIPQRLRYGKTVVVFETVFIDLNGVPMRSWVFRARTLTREPRFCIIQASTGTMWELNIALRTGFVLRDGTPAARLLDRLVTDGHAEKQPIADPNASHIPPCSPSSIAAHPERRNTTWLQPSVDQRGMS